LSNSKITVEHCIISAADCKAADFTDYSNVDADDLDRLCTNWLAGI